jgi:hypothetical protein
LGKVPVAYPIDEALDRCQGEDVQNIETIPINADVQEVVRSCREMGIGGGNVHEEAVILR